MKKFIIFFIVSIFSQKNFAQNVGIGTTTPAAKLHIYDGPSAITPFFSARIIVETNSHTYINLLSPDPFETGILFGSGNNPASGVISYNGADNVKGFVFSTNGNQQRMVINKDGNVGIGSGSPNATALLEMNSTSKGFLPPRMNMAQRNAITTPATGLMLYCTDCSPAGPYSYNGSSWVSMLSSASSIYTIGQFAQGGIVFWVDDSGQHGLVAAPADANAGAIYDWMIFINGMPNPFTNTNAIREGIYGGEYNTNHINADQGNGDYASMIATRYTGNDYGDWYLPSIGELKLMIQNIYPVSGLANNTFYWSSTEVMFPTGSTSYTAWCDMANDSGGFPDIKGKTLPLRVRAVRRF